jgi:hypothetical protein
MPIGRCSYSFDAALGQGKPTDLTSMTAWLADTGSLEKVGGNGRLIELVERVSSTASNRTGGPTGDGQVPSPPVDPFRQ